MAQFIYVSSDTANGPARATTLGCGWVAAVPSQWASIATAPCAIVAGAGQTAVVPDDTGQATAAAISTAAAPILSAEQAANQAAATQNTNAATLLQKAANALTNNQTYLGLSSPSNAQNAAQVKALTQQMNALIRLVANQLDSTSGT